MPRPAYELADVVRQHGEAYRRTHRLSREQLRALRAIETCRTAALGGHVEQCSQCSHQRISYNSCRNRHCPKCQNAERSRWLESRKADLLPLQYFHVVFTVPEEIAAIAFQNKAIVYGILFRAAAQTLLQIAADPQHLGATIGFFAILHTWGQILLHHPHLHCLVPGGGLSPDGQRWISCRPGFFLPVRVLSRRFRTLFLEALQQAFQQGKLRFFGELEALQQHAEFTRYLSPLHNRDWVVYAKPPFGGPAHVIEYLGRYTHRVALSNDRILALPQGQVTFQWKDYRNHGKPKPRTMTLAAQEFLRRFLIHTLPTGFQRIRHFGLLANRHRKHNIIRCRQLLSNAATALLPPAEACLVVAAALVLPIARCPVCGRGEMIRIQMLPAYRWPAQPPDTS